MIWQQTLSPAESSELTFSDPPHPADVLIVGADLAGLAAAYYLALGGASVQILAENGLPPEAGCGAIWPNALVEQSFDIQDLARRARDDWARLAVRPEFRLDWRVTGLIELTDDSLSVAQARAAGQQNQGVSVTAVDAGQVAYLEPGLAARTGAGMHYPSEAHLNPLKARLSFLRAARQAGVRVTRGAQVESIDESDAGRPQVQTSTGAFAPRTVIVNSLGEAGPARRSTCAAWIPAGFPRAAVQTVLASKPCPGRIRSGLLIASERPSSGWLRLEVVQLKTGEVVVVGDSAAAGQPIPADALASIVRELLAPPSPIEFDSSWQVTQQCGSTGCPLVERVSERSDVWLSLGRSELTTLLAPRIGQLLAQSIREGKPAPGMEAFRRDRISPEVSD